MKKVNASQIDKIDRFLEKKDVIYTDLKMELIDHISSSIENQWEKNPELTFDKAFHNEYKNFGIYGFSELLEKREQDLNTYYWKSIGKHLMNWLKIPQLFLTLLVGYFSFQIMQTDYNILVRNVFVRTLILSGLIQFLIYYFKTKQKKKKGQPILLMDKVIAKASGSLYFIYILIQNTIVTFEKITFTNNESILWAVFMTVLVFLFYHIFYDFPKNKEIYFRHNYIIS